MLKSDYFICEDTSISHYQHILPVVYNYSFVICEDTSYLSEFCQCEIFFQYCKVRIESVRMIRLQETYLMKLSIKLLVTFLQGRLLSH